MKKILFKIYIAWFVFYNEIFLKQRTVDYLKYKSYKLKLYNFSSNKRFKDYYSLTTYQIALYKTNKQDILTPRDATPFMNKVRLWLKEYDNIYFGSDEIRYFNTYKNLFKNII